MFRTPIVTQSTVDNNNSPFFIACMASLTIGLMTALLLLVAGAPIAGAVFVGAAFACVGFVFSALVGCCGLLLGSGGSRHTTTVYAEESVIMSFDERDVRRRRAPNIFVSVPVGMPVTGTTPLGESPSTKF